MEHTDKIAKICHEVNRAYCIATGDLSQLAWENAPEWQKSATIKGVEFKIANPNVTPEDIHDYWCAQKWKDGWKYGAVKNPELKEHPCLVKYSELPQVHRVKDYLFNAVVVASL